MRAIYVIVMGALLSSCASLNYYSSTEVLDRDTLDSLNTVSYEKHNIRVGDRLSVGIHGEDAISVGSVYGVYNSNPVYGKWIQVHQDSSIVLPRIGKMSVAGLSRLELIKALQEKYNTFIVNPVVDVKIHSHQISVLGQVIKPGNYPLESDVISLAEALAESGGTDFYARVTHVCLVRDSISYRIDMKKSPTSLLTDVNMVSGDVLMVPTRRTKSIEKSSSALIATASAVTVLILLFGQK